MKSSIGLAMATAILSTTAAEGQAPATPPRLQPATGMRLNVDYMVGAWSDREDCALPIRFQRNGRFNNPDGTSGTWRLDGDRLTLIGTREVTVRVVPRDRNETIVVQQNGTLGYSRRCN